MPETLTAPAPLSITASRLGHLGLLPFVLGAVLVWLVNEAAHPYVALGLSSYAALIVASIAEHFQLVLHALRVGEKAAVALAERLVGAEHQHPLRRAPDTRRRLAQQVDDETLHVPRHLLVQ